MENFIAYVRTSTGKQVLGLEEQKLRIDQFIQKTGGNLIDVVIEQDSGKNNKRIKLDFASNLCLKHGYTLLFTKLDRLSREVEFLFTLRNKGIKLHCIELPELNTLTLGIFGSVAQWERELISSRTKSGLAALKARGVKLGKPENLTLRAREKGVASNIRNRFENENWKMACMFIEHFQMKNGFINYSKISFELNKNGYKTRYGCMFSPASVRRLYLDFIYKKTNSII